MLTYVTFSLFESPAQTLVNTVNTVGVMGKGIAAVFKRLYPDMYKEYRRLCQAKQLDIGMLYIYRTPNKIVINFPTKKHWRQPSSVEFIKAGLDKLVAHYKDYGISSVSFPQLGCGHGELGWENQVQPIMEHYLKDLPIPIYIHLYKQSPDFVPERLDSKYARQVRIERQRISSEQLWQDLANLTSAGSLQLTLFGPIVEVNSEQIIFKQLSGKTIIVYREDIEDLWNILRIRGTVQEVDVPESLKEDETVEWLFEFLGRLKYIRSVQLRTRSSKDFGQGLQYDPQPDSHSIKKADIIV